MQVFCPKKIIQNMRSAMAKAKANEYPKATTTISLFVLDFYKSINAVLTDVK